MKTVQNTKAMRHMTRSKLVGSDLETTRKLVKPCVAKVSDL
jgi:hypothetical protein